MSTPERQMRLKIISLALCGAAMIAAGATAEWWWLLGIGVWVLAAAFLMEMIYRP
ncbi:hypothetical protein [Streptomyces sp. NRRL S-378]|uniref:hypothetical protein n=1 Tax=Streptomyces sp. NRRL S-378 TaxID=1463904 RepID=UPI000A538BD6|nr:hypothetical protein [Streptomyces sp. NRRL S-378]